jgi:hypothetical protein
VGFPTQEMEENFHPVTWRPNTRVLRKLGLYVPLKLVTQIEFLRRNKGSPTNVGLVHRHVPDTNTGIKGPFNVI